MINNWHIIRFDEVGSTNDIALEYSRNFTQNFVILAESQTSGRGRRGRTWLSLKGNLFFSAVIEFDIRHLGYLVAAASLSVLQAIKSLAPTAAAELKWPNDVLLNHRKVCGMLIEKGAGNTFIVGIGVNIKQSPQDSAMLYPVISLQEAGITTTAPDLLDVFLDCFSHNLRLLEQQDFAQIRQTWLDNTCKLGQKIAVRQENTEKIG